ncbi:hypothetical protein LE191_07390 [Janthinobacterium sp. HSC-3S05]|uniref:hypothetical protein n=1 Tax=Janthinobacterium lividum TaxID=29581 RepID=UPI001CD8309D|nr:hypothetical protein [Janthinobacterium lividum]MCA1859936.1 hypothetical protein [Janthinobacterium lividum]
MSDIDKSNASYWTHKAIQTGDEARVQKNRNTIENIANSQKIRELEKENDFYKRLLKRSSAVIALNNEDFRKTYEAEQEEANFYKNLLSKPMAEIAEYDKNFKEMYDRQQELLALWMVGQRAMKEVAIKLGMELGKTKEQVLDLSKEAQRNVLENNTQHGNNVSDLIHAKSHINNLKNKML